MKLNSPYNVGAFNLVRSRYFSSSFTLYLSSLDKPYPYLKSVKSKTEFLNDKVDSSNINEEFKDDILYTYLPSLSYKWGVLGQYKDKKHSNFSWSLFKLKLDLDTGYRYGFDFCLFNYSNDKNRELIKTNLNEHFNKKYYKEYFNLNLYYHALSCFNKVGYSPCFHADVETNNRFLNESYNKDRLEFSSKNMEWELCRIYTYKNMIGEGHFPVYTGVLLIISRNKLDYFSNKYRTDKKI